MVDHLAVITEQSSRFVEVLGNGPLDAAVPGTPEWDLAALGKHMVDVQTWATAIIRTGAPPEIDEPPAVDDPAEALAASSAALVQALEAADPDAPCWNFTPTAPHVMSFWFRRQANEVAMHRWDAESAVSETPAPLDPAIAVDVIDEYLNHMLNRVIVREELDVSTLSSDVHVHCTDTEGEWTFEIVDGLLNVTAEHRKAAVAIRGGASDLALFLHNRISSDRVELFGDEEALAAWRAVFSF